MSTQEEASLYDRLGGINNIASVVDDFIDRIMVDPKLNANPAVDNQTERNMNVSYAQWIPTPDLRTKQFGISTDMASQFQFESATNKRWQLALPPIEQRFFQIELQNQIDREFAAVGRFNRLDIKSGQTDRTGFESIDNLFGEFDQLIDEFEIESA